MEATHHGPLIDKPCVFIEIGSSETDYTNRRAGFIIAKTIYETVKEFKESMEQGVETIYFKSPDDLITPRE